MEGSCKNRGNLASVSQLPKKDSWIFAFELFIAFVLPPPLTLDLAQQFLCSLQWPAVSHPEWLPCLAPTDVLGLCICMAVAYALFLFPRCVPSFPQPHLYSCFCALQHLIHNACQLYPAILSPMQSQPLQSCFHISFISLSSCLLPMYSVQLLYLNSPQLLAPLSPDTLLFCLDFSYTLPLLPLCNCFVL